MSFRTSPNPENLSKEQILAMILFCPTCGTHWPSLEKECANKECGTKLRVEPKAFNWWLFYPKTNGWNNL